MALRSTVTGDSELPQHVVVLLRVLIARKYNGPQFHTGLGGNFHRALQILAESLLGLSGFLTVIVREGVSGQFLTRAAPNLGDQTGREMQGVALLICPDDFLIGVQRLVLILRALLWGELDQLALSVGE